MGMWRSVGKEPDTPTILDKMDWNCWIVWSVGQIVCHYFFLECPSSCMSSWQPLPQDHDHQGQKQHDHPHHLHFSFSFACYFDIPKFKCSPHWARTSWQKTSSCDQVVSDHWHWLARCKSMPPRQLHLYTPMPILLLFWAVWAVKKSLHFKCTVIAKMLFRRSIAFAHAVSDWAKSESKAKGGSCASCSIGPLLSFNVMFSIFGFRWVI